MDLNSIHIEKYNQPNDDDYLWRYIKPQFVDSFLRGDIYFAMLSQFSDSFEGITPTHYFMYQFLSRGLGHKFDFSKPIKELNNDEEKIGTLLMFLGIYDLEKKLSRITGITDKSELSALVKHHVENMNDFVKPQLDFQSKHYSSCWFVGDYIESALMWSAYSEPNGIAIRIKYSDFKDAIETYFEKHTKATIGIEECQSGLITYADFNDSDDWLAQLEQGRNPVFYKQRFYKEEKEFRFVLKRYESYPFEAFTQKHKIFHENSKFQIILHPSSGPDEMEKIRAKFPEDLKYRIEMSEMSFS